MIAVPGLALAEGRVIVVCEVLAVVLAVALAKALTVALIVVLIVALAVTLIETLTVWLAVPSLAVPLAISLPIILAITLGIVLTITLAITLAVVLVMVLAVTVAVITEMTIAAGAIEAVAACRGPGPRPRRRHALVVGLLPGHEVAVALNLKPGSLEERHGLGIGQRKGDPKGAVDDVARALRRQALNRVRGRDLSHALEGPGQVPRIEGLAVGGRRVQAEDVAASNGVCDAGQRHHAGLAGSDAHHLERLEAVLHELDAHGARAAAGDAHAEAVGVVGQGRHSLGQRPAADGLLGLLGAGDADVVGRVCAVAIVDEGGGSADGVGNVVEEAADAVDDLVDGGHVHHGLRRSVYFGFRMAALSRGSERAAAPMFAETGDDARLATLLVFWTTRRHHHGHHNTTGSVGEAVVAIAVPRINSRSRRRC